MVTIRPRARASRRLRVRAGTIVSADIDNVYDGLPELLPLIDIMIGSKEFPRRVTGIQDHREALVELKSAIMVVRWWA